MDKYKLMKEIGGYAQQHFQGGSGGHGGHGHQGGPHGDHYGGQQFVQDMGQQMFGHGGGHGHQGGHHGYGGQGHGQMSDQKAMREAMKLAKNKDFSQIDPAVLDYAATKLQAGFRGYMS